MYPYLVEKRAGKKKKWRLAGGFYKTGLTKEGPKSNAYTAGKRGELVVLPVWA